MPFDLFTGLFFLAFFIILAMIVVQLTVEATVVAKRERTWRNQNHHGTTYYATFQVESGDRMELPMRGTDYGMLAEGDRGRLTFQGTRFLGFERM